MPARIPRFSQLHARAAGIHGTDGPFPLAKGALVNAEGVSVNAEGVSVDAEGALVNAEGVSVDAKRALVNVKGVSMDHNALSMNGHEAARSCPEAPPISGGNRPWHSSMRTARDAKTHRGPKAVLGGTFMTFLSATLLPGTNARRSPRTTIRGTLAPLIGITLSFAAVNTSHAQGTITFDHFSPVFRGSENQAVGFYPPNAPASLLVSSGPYNVFSPFLAALIPDNLEAGDQGRPIASHIDVSIAFESTPMRNMYGSELWCMSFACVFNYQSPGDVCFGEQDTDAQGLAYLYTDSGRFPYFAAFGILPPYLTSTVYIWGPYTTGIETQQLYPDIVFGACGIGDVDSNGHSHILIVTDRGANRLRQVDMGPNGSGPFVELADWRATNATFYGDLAFDHDRLFASVGGRIASAPFHPVHHCPVIQSHPANATSCSRYSVSFAVSVAGASPLSYRWQVRGTAQPDTWIDLSDRSGPNGVSGSATDTVTIVSPSGAAVGQYRVMVSNSCGTITSNPATLTICVADTDDGSGTGTCDGGVTIDDLLYYITLYADGGARADVDDGSGTGTPDGGVTIDDLLYYLQRFEAGC